MRYRWRGAGMHQHEAAGAIGILDHALAMARLAEGGCLLVAGNPGNRDRVAEPLGGGMPDQATAGHDLGQHRARDVEQRQQGVIPGQRVDVEQHRARRVAGIGHVAPAQAVHQIAVDGAKGQLTPLGALAGARDMVEQPLQLGGRKIRVQFQTRQFGDHGCPARFAQPVAGAGRAPVLPDDGVGHGFAGHAVPQERRFALVGDADRGDARRVDAAVGQRGARAGKLAGPDVRRIVLDPAGLREMLGKFALAAGHGHAGIVEHDRPRTGGALVEGEDVVGH